MTVVSKFEGLKKNKNKRRGTNMKSVTNHRLLLLMTIASVLVPHELATLAYRLKHMNICENGPCGKNQKGKNEMIL